MAQAPEHIPDEIARQGGAVATAERPRQLARLPHVHPALRWPLLAYKGLAVLVGLGLATNILLLLAAVGPAGFRDAAFTQVRALWSLIQGQPVASGVVLALLGLLFILAMGAERQYEAEVETAKRAGVAAAGAEAGRQAAREEFAQFAARAGQRAAANVAAVPEGVVSPSGLPRPASLIGRDEALERLMAALREGANARDGNAASADAVGIFAVEGLAGIGKTALAAEAVARLAGDRTAFPGGAAWISCEGLTDAEGLGELWSRVARALGAEAVAALPEAERRRTALRAALHVPDRPRLLLALDNIEPGLSAEAVLDTLAGGQATLLLTARQAVAPARVRALQLEPLPDPDAVRLFTQRLRQVDPARPRPDERDDLNALVTLVGGLPLALELAAAYAGVQRRSLAEIVAEVRHDGLEAGAMHATAADAATAQQRSVRPRFDRSWAVLSATQQRLFAGLSLLEGATFPRAAAQALAHVAADPSSTTGGGASDERVDGDLDALVGLSLVDPQPNGRLRLHPLLRKYAEEQLEAMPRPTVERLGDAAVAYWYQYAQAHRGYAGMDALEAEAAGLMGALAWAHAHGHHAGVLALAHALNRYWFVRGRADESRIARPWALDAARALGDLREQLWAYHELAVMQSLTGRREEARAGYERALALARQLGDLREECDEVLAIAVLDAEGEHREKARAGYERVLELARQLGDREVELRALRGLAVRDRKEGNAAQARERSEQVLRLARELGDQAEELTATHDLAILDADAGLLNEARPGFLRALELARQQGNLAAQSTELQNMGALDLQAGEATLAREELTEALRLARYVQQPSLVAEARWWLAELERVEGAHEAACAGFREALTIYEQLGSPEAEATRQRLLALGCAS
ncbi:MAG: ATP-binding protein [Ktedonobacterales bacterium]|nr:ATP-binding protein [Ktedonobacterales bacterium]